MNENTEWMIDEIKKQAHSLDLQIFGLPDEVKTPLRDRVVKMLAPVTYVLVYSSWDNHKWIIGVGHELDLIKAMAQRWYDEEYRPSLHTKIFQDDELTWGEHPTLIPGVDGAPFGRSSILFGNAAAFDIDEALFVEIFQS